MKALVFRPGAPAVLEDVAGFKGIQDTVDGWVEVVRLESQTDGWCFELWCDEDGIGKGLPLNVWAVGPEYAGAPICGTAVLTLGRVLADGEQEFRSLSPDDAAAWAMLLPRARRRKEDL